MDYSQTLELALEMAASTAPNSMHDVASIISYMNIAASTLPNVSDAEREDACTLLFQVSDAVMQACAAHAPREARLLDRERPDFPPSVWRDALAGLVEWHMVSCAVLPREQCPSTFSLLALGHGRALLQLVLWGGPGDLDSVIGIAKELLAACWERGEFETPLVAMAFQLLGDAHRLRSPEDTERDLEVSARSYQACIRRLSDPADSARISNLAKLCDVATSLVSLGQRQWWRETFAAPEELIPHLVEQPPDVEAGRYAQAAVALWEYAERAPLMPSERRHLALRSIGLADEVLQTPEDLTDIARSSLCATLLSAAILLHLWYGVDVIREAVRRVREAQVGITAWAEAASLEQRRVLARALAFSRVRGNLLLAAEILDQDVGLSIGAERGQDHLVLAAINFVLLHDGQRWRLRDASEHITAGMTEHTGPKSDLLFTWFGMLQEKIKPLQAQIDANGDSAFPSPPAGRGLDLKVRIGSRTKLDIPDGMPQSWLLSIDFAVVEGPRAQARSVAEGLETAFLCKESCPACHTAFEWTAHVYVDEAGDPDLFGRLSDPSLHVHICEQCGAVLQFVFPLFVSRPWSGYPILCALNDIGMNSYSNDSVLAVRRYLAQGLPKEGIQKFAEALCVPSDVLLGFVSVLGQSPEPAEGLLPQSVEIRRQLDIASIPGASPLLSDDTPAAFLGASRDAYDSRLDPVSWFPRHDAYRRHELRAWLKARDSEAVLERRDALTITPSGDSVVMDDMIACGVPLARIGFDHYVTDICDELDRQAAQLIDHDRKLDSHREAAEIVGKAIDGRGEFVLFLRSFSLEIPKTKPEDMLSDPYGFTPDQQLGFSYAVGDTLQDCLAAHVGATLPVVGMSDHLSVLRIDSPSRMFAKFRVKSIEWVDVVSLLIEHAKHIVLFFADIGPGTRTELDAIDVLDAQTRTGVFLFNRYFVPAGPNMSGEESAVIRDETWHLVFDEPSYAERFAFVHSYLEDDDVCERRLDALVAGRR